MYEMNKIDVKNDFMKSGFTKTIDNVRGAIVIPAVMYFMGVPLVVVFLAWLLFFRG